MRTVLKSVFRTVLTVSCFGLPTYAVAHTLTVNYASQPPQIALAHNGAFDPIAKERIGQVVAVDRRGRVLSSQAVTGTSGTDLTVTGRAPAGAVWVSYSGVAAGATAAGIRRVGPKGTHSDVVSVSRSQVFALAINNPSTPLGALPTGRIALLPLSPLSAARSGTMIKVGAIYAGAPLVNTIIRLEALTLEQGGAIVTTDSNGEASIPLGAPGRRLFAVSLVETPSTDPSVDTLRLQASFGFEVLAPR